MIHLDADLARDFNFVFVAVKFPGHCKHISPGLATSLDQLD